MTAPIQGYATVLDNVPLARDTYCLRLREPQLAAAIQPGQFVMLALGGTTDPLLGRPFALFDTVLDHHELPLGIDIGYQVVGKLTTIMGTLRAGDALRFWGPLGNSFPDLDGIDHVGLVAGGIGQTPFLAYARQLLGQRAYGSSKFPRRMVQRVSLYYGARTADLLAGVKDFEKAGAQVHVATDDGSAGFHGFVTELVERQEKPQHLIGCGPGPMMKALAEVAGRWQVPCHLSLESPMACGLGICFSCVTRVRTADGWDYRRVCVDGPIFDAATLAWE
jgi:dihydroorotate dehydrogenase electron transfer subunit